MTKDKYEEIKMKVLGEVNGNTFKWELLKAIWELTRVLKGELND